MCWAAGARCSPRCPRKSNRAGRSPVTHPDVTRYFMTADEAVQLVLQAAVVGRGSEVLVLDIGVPVRIADIARRLAARSSQPVDIVFTGLRPGEKLAEDLLGQGEVDDRPRHPLIRHASVPPLPPTSSPSSTRLPIPRSAAGAGSLRRACALRPGRPRASRADRPRGTPSRV